MPRIAWPIQLDSDTEKELGRLIRAPSTPQAIVLRARIILAAAGGGSNQEIAAVLEVAANTVTKWRQRFRMFGLKGLTNWGHGGRRRKYGAEVRERLQRLFGGLLRVVGSDGHSLNSPAN